MARSGHLNLILNKCFNFFRVLGSIKAVSTAVIYFLCYFFSISAPAQSQPDSSLSYAFNPVSLEQGLPHFATHHIMQDSFGFIWISTREGLCRFDGTSCTVFRKDDTNSLKLASNLVWLTFEDSRQRLWIGTKGGGLSLFDPRTNNAKVFMNDEEDRLSLSHNTVTAIFEDTNNEIWIGTDGGGLNKIIEDQTADSIYFQHIPLEDNEDNARSILDIIETEDGKLWLATYGNGIMIFDPKTTEVQKIDSKSQGLYLNDDYVMTLAKEDSIIWTGTKFGGLTKINRHNGTATHYRYDQANPKSFPHNFIWDIFIDDRSNKWIGTYGGGLALLTEEGTEFQVIRDANETRGFTDNFVLHTMQDNQGQFWIATDNQGVFRFKTRPVFVPVDIQWTGIPNTSNLIINDLFLDSSERFWISTNSGLFLADKELKTASPISTDLGTTIFYQVNEDENGTIWIASNHNLGYFKPETGLWGEIDIAGMLEAPGTDRLFDIEFGENGILWLASDGGLIRFNQATRAIQLFSHQDNDSTSISGNKLDNIYMDGSHIWVATDDQGVSLFNINTYQAKKIDFGKFLPTNRITEHFSEIKEDYLGNVAIGTADQGIYYLHRTGEKIDSVTYLSSPKNLRSSQVYDIESIDDYLLITHRAGMAKWDGKGLNPVNIKLPHEIKISGAKELYQADNDTYFFSRDKIFRLFPEHISTPTKMPEIQITGIEIFNQVIKQEAALHFEEKLEFDYNQDFLTISYTVLNYDPNAFFPTEYILEGHDPYWLEGGEAESINYTNLEPGEYVFKARFADFEPQVNQVKIPVLIEAPFWETTIFRLLILSLIISVLYVFFKYRTYYLLREEKTRTRIARDLHDDLSGTLSSISFFSEAAQRVGANSGEAKRFLSIIDKSASEAKEKINDIIWAIDPSKDDWSVFLKKCKRFAADALDSKGIEYELQIGDDFKTPLGLELRQNLWLIYKEIIHNLTKHSEATEALVTFLEKDKHIYLEITDNGIGFDKNQENNRNGLPNIRHRAEIIGAKVELITNPGEGTTWKLTFKAKKTT